MPTATKSSVQLPKELFAFLRQLKRNNDRDWFNAHKEQYQQQVRDPLLAFIEAFAPKLNRISRSFIADPSPTGGSMFRIHRDTRFSNDKTPYKTHASAQFRHNAGKDVHAPGFYLHLEPKQVFVGAGLWHPDTATAHAIREGIDAKQAAWKKIVGSAPFKDGTFALAGESLKRPPRGVDADHPLIDDLKRKDFIVVSNFDEQQACAPDFLDVFAARCKAAAPFMRFLTEAVGQKW